MKITRSILVFLICLVLSLGIKPGFASPIFSKIEVLINDLDLFVNNKQIVVDNLLYNNTTYVPLRAVAEMTGMEVKWDGQNRKVDLVNPVNAMSSEAFDMKTTDNKYHIVGIHPKPLSEGNFFQWKYLNIVFDEDIKGITDNKKVVLIDNKGNRVDVRCEPGTTAKDNFIIMPNKELELNTYYSLYIPKETIIMKNDDLYLEEISVYFKTATNAIRGEITSANNLFGKVIKIKNNSGEEYSSKIVGKNEFFFSDVVSGSFEVMVDAYSFGNITVKPNTINNIEITDK